MLYTKKNWECTDSRYFNKNIGEKNRRNNNSTYNNVKKKTNKVALQEKELTWRRGWAIIRTTRDEGVFANYSFTRRCISRLPAWLCLSIFLKNK